MELIFGKEQIATSNRMQRYPQLGKLVNKTLGYTNLGNYARSVVFKKLIRKLQMNEFQTILDLGCGYGEYSLMLARALPNTQIYALDIDSSRIAMLNRAVAHSGLTNISTYAQPVGDFHLKDIDFIFSVDVFEHIAPVKMPFAESYSLLKSGGYLLVKIPNKLQRTLLPEDWFDEHHAWLEEEHIGQVYDLEGLKKRFKDEGFQVVYASYTDGWLSRLGWELAWLGKKGGMITQAVSLILAKGLVHIDQWVHNGKWGNAIQVIAKKP